MKKTYRDINNTWAKVLFMKSFLIDKIKLQTSIITEA